MECKLANLLDTHFSLQKQIHTATGREKEILKKAEKAMSDKIVKELAGSCEALGNKRCEYCKLDLYT